MKTRVIILIFVIFLSACTKQRVQREEPQTPQTKFGVTVQDTLVTIRENYPSPKPTPLVDGREVQVASADWLGLSVQLLETSQSLSGEDHERLQKAGRDLGRKFYEIPDSHTSMTALSQPPGNPFTEAGAFYAKPMLAKKWEEALDSVKTKVVAAAAQNKILVDDLSPNPLPEILLQRVIDGLKDFGSRLSALRDGTGDAIIDHITAVIGSQYVKDLEELRDSARINKNVPLSSSLQKLGASLKKLTEISEWQKLRLLVDVNWGVTVAQKSEKMSTAQDALAILVDFWLSKDFRNMYPENLKNLFKGLGNAQILALATENRAPLLEKADWARVRGRTDLTLMPDNEVIAQFVQNNGLVLGSREWENLKQNQLSQLNQLIKNSEIQKLADLIAVNDIVTTDEERRQVLVNSWLGLASRLSMPDNLRSAFAMFSDDQLQMLKNDNLFINNTLWLAATGNVKLAIARHQIIKGIENFGAKPGEIVSPAKGLENFRSYFQEKIIGATRAKVVSAVWPIAKKLSNQLKETLLPQLDQQKASGQEVAESSYKIYSRYYVGKLIFWATDITKGSLDDDQSGVKEAADNSLLQKYPMALLEKQTLKLIPRQGRFDSVPTDSVTSAEVLGMGLSESFFQLQNSTPPTKENALSRSESVKINFQAITKMMALAGYKGYDGQLTESLHLPMTAGHSGEILDIRNYDPARSVFAAPDRIVIKGGYKLDRSSEENGPAASVRGQMELLRGYAHMVNFFKPWRENTFNTGLGSLRIDEDPTLSAFDKDDFFILSLGLSSIILKNIPVKMLGLITDTGDFKEAVSVPDTSKLNIRGAVLSDYSLTGVSHVIQTRDLALGIQAISEFYESFEDVEKSSNPVILELRKTKPLTSIRADLQKLLSGLILFSTGRLMAKDGGFAPSYDADSKKASQGVRHLNDQLLMERALITAGRVLQSNFMSAKAVDNFFFLNGHFWNEETGFYNEVEGDGASGMRLIDAALAVENVTSVMALLPVVMTQGPNSEETKLQTYRLQQSWLRHFLNVDLLSLSPVSQVSAFSL